MSDKNRYVNTKFWTDNYISNLDPTEKLIFIYLLTNPLTNLSGIYEIQLKRIAFDTGIEKEMVDKILQRFEKDDKIAYYNGWIIIVHFMKHQKINPSIRKSIEDNIKKVPEDVMIVFDRLSTGCIYLNLNSNLNINLNPNLNPMLENLNQFHKSEDKNKKEWIPPLLQDFKQYIIDKKLSLDADRLYEYYSEGDWHDGKGNKVKNWKQKLLTLNSYQKQKQPEFTDAYEVARKMEERRKANE